MGPNSLQRLSSDDIKAATSGERVTRVDYFLSFHTILVGNLYFSVGCLCVILHLAVFLSVCHI